MECNINLNDEECDYILNAIQLEEKRLRKLKETLKITKYENVSGFFRSEEAYDDYTENEIKIIEEQINQLENIYDKIISKIL